METRELRTFDEFRQARLDDVGFVVITDTARPAIVHKLNGPCVSADNFKVKVMLGENSTGKYYLVDSVSSALSEFRASACKICKPHRPDKDVWKS
jgi:hypothetical protein